MKTLYNFIAIVIIASIFIYSCGEDTVTNNNGNNGSLPVIRIDTFILPTNQAGFFDTLHSFRQAIDIDSFKVSFKVSTNNDSNAYDYVGFAIVDSGNVISEGTLHHNFNPNVYYAFYGYSQNGNTEKTITLRSGLRNNYLPQTFKYISIIDFKIEHK